MGYYYGIIGNMGKKVEVKADEYDPDLLKRDLDKIGFNLIYLIETGSTMDLIEEYIKKGNQKPVVALTDHQIKGAGREGRKWVDKRGSSLMFSINQLINQSSIVLYADLAALSICQVLQRLTGKKFMVKYPNDIVFEDKKLGGILVKNIYDEKLGYLGTNIGVGINVHYQSDEMKDIPADYAPTSLDICTGSFNKRQKLLVDIVDKLRFMSTEAEVISKNPNAKKSFDEKWLEVSSVYKRKIAIIKGDKIVDSGIVANTEIGRGIEIMTEGARKWVSLFETDMKVRIA